MATLFDLSPADQQAAVRRLQYLRARMEHDFWEYKLGKDAHGSGGGGGGERQRRHLTYTLMPPWQWMRVRDNSAIDAAGAVPAALGKLNPLH